MKLTIEQIRAHIQVLQVNNNPKRILDYLELQREVCLYKVIALIFLVVTIVVTVWQLSSNDPWTWQYIVIGILVICLVLISFRGFKLSLEFEDYRGDEKRVAAIILGRIRRDE